MLQNLQAFFDLFSPPDYLKEYYGDVGPENTGLLSFFTEAYSGFKDGSQKVLELGGGPTVYQLISMAPAASSIFFTDYLEKNLSQIKYWINGDKRAFNWDGFVSFSLKAEDGGSDLAEVEARKFQIKSKLRLSRCDVFNDSDLASLDAPYDVVSMNFVPESITSNLEDYKNVLKRSKRLIKQSGYLVLTGLLGANYWIEKGKKFPAACITENTLKKTLSDLDFEIEIFRSVPAQHEENSEDFQGYQGIYMVKARSL